MDCMDHCSAPASLFSELFLKESNETPGPGFYSVTHQSAEINGTSLSKKGTAYFPALVPCTACKKISNYPAANAYKILSCFQPKQDFSKENPSHYDINNSLIKVSPKGITSCFKSKTSRLTRMFTGTGSEVEVLQCAALKGSEFCLTLSAPAIPPCKDPPSPGPGQYNPVDYKGSPKQDCSKQTAFVSTTGRWTERG
ncbi:O(6)-methylguanine-induced apoptosis 2 [Buteo buteo]|uniref:O(6)-methylguanine-induced apoptosis 2 n=1 Tax=Buteo buteo TaxID=30397 RepID=UPI003EBFEAFE